MFYIFPTFVDMLTSFIIKSFMVSIPIWITYHHIILQLIFLFQSQILSFFFFFGWTHITIYCYYWEHHCHYTLEFIQRFSLNMLSHPQWFCTFMLSPLPRMLYLHLLPWREITHFSMPLLLCHWWRLCEVPLDYPTESFCFLSLHGKLFAYYISSEP